MVGVGWFWIAFVRVLQHLGELLLLLGLLGCRVGICVAVSRCALSHCRDDLVGCHWWIRRVILHRGRVAIGRSRHCRRKEVGLGVETNTGSPLWGRGGSSEQL